MSMVHINWRPNPRELRSFGLSLLIGFGLIGALLWFGVWPFAEARPTAARVVWAAGTAGGLLGLTGTRLALPLYWAWMGVAFVMGSLFSRVLLALVYFLVFTPMGVGMRLTGRDRLQLRRKNPDSYWHDLPAAPPAEQYERQF